MNELTFAEEQEFLPNTTFDKDCVKRPKNQLQATNDCQAVQEWLNEYRHTENTFKAYRRETTRLLLWCQWHQKNLSDLTKADFAEYFAFLANPQPAEMWCGPKKPFVGLLSISSQKTAIVIIKSLMNYLVEAGYLLANPANLIKKHQAKSFESKKYDAMARILEVTEWQAIQAVLENMPEHTNIERYKKRTAIFVISFLFLTGIRLHELETLSWGAIRFYQDKWWLFLKGKGSKKGMVPIHDVLLDHIKIYRLYHHLPILPEVNEPTSVVLNTKQEGLKKSQLYNIVKSVGKQAAELVENPSSKERLLKFSPHWLRHLSASQQDRVGIPLKQIQENHRHLSEQTTQIYIHSEQNARHEQLQKLTAPISAKQFQPTREKKTIKLKMQLKPKVFFLTKTEIVFLAIENMVLRGAILEKQLIDKTATYVLDSNKVFHENLIRQIKEEAELRFCEVICNIA